MKTARALFFAAFCGATVLGQTVSGTLLGPTGAGLAGVTVNASNGTTATSASNGTFTLTVPAGTYDFEFLPPTGFAPRLLEGVAVSASLSLGNITISVGYTVTGTATNSGGGPIVGGDINVYDALGTKLFTPGDNTTTSGTFSVVVPPGSHTLRVAPAAGQILVAQEQPLTVTGNTSAGTIVLPAGVVLSGTIVRQGTGTPVVGADIDVDDAAGNRIATPSDNTNGSGVFSVIIPSGTVTVSIEPPVGIALVGLRIPGIVVSGNTSIGTRALQPGFFVTGTVLSAAGPVVGADVDAKNLLGGITLYTPNDSTTTSGAFSVVVPAGNYEFDVCPPTTSTLVGRRFVPVSVNANVSLGMIVLSSGVLISGNVTGPLGAEREAVIDVTDPATGVRLPLPGNVTNNAGQYQIRVPAGTWTFTVTSGKFSIGRDIQQSGVTVSGAAGPNFTLPVMSTKLYVALAGPSSVPNGGFVAFDGAIVNPNNGAQAGVLYVVLVDPTGGETPLFSPSNLVTTPLQFSFFPGLTVSLPSQNPAWLGLPFSLRVRVETPGGQIIDSDEFSFVIQ